MKDQWEKEHQHSGKKWEKLFIFIADVVVGEPITLKKKDVLPVDMDITLELDDILGKQKM